MDRRTFLKYSTAGVTGTLAGGAGLLSWSPRAFSATINVTLGTAAGDIAMVDGTSVYMLTFTTDGLPSFPGPTIICQEGDVLNIVLNNSLSTPVAFAVQGTSIQQTAAPGISTIINFNAPVAGTYLYHDNQNNGVNRVVGLHGALIVMPAGVKNQSFGGGPSFVRQYKWLCHSLDTTWGDQLRNNGHNAVTQINSASFLPRYFTLNGYSFPDTHDNNTLIAGNYNDRALIRMLNSGGMIQSLHFHANHVDVISINRKNFSKDAKQKDSVSLYPLEVRDVIFPFKAPPDAWPAVSGLQHFPMHCHSEMSQTAGGGLYPHGMHTEIIFGKAPSAEPDITQGTASLPGLSGGGGSGGSSGGGSGGGSGSGGSGGGKKKGKK